MQNDKLVEAPEPCPFCGSGNCSNTEYQKPGSLSRWHSVECGGCGSLGPETEGCSLGYYGAETIAKVANEAIAAWNRRATLSRSDDGAGEAEQAECAGMDKAATFCIETLAKALDVDDWQIADGSEEWHGDVAGTIYNVLKAGRVYDEEDGRVARLEVAHPPAAVAGEGEKLAELIRTRLLDIHPDEQDLQLEDDDWRLILQALSQPAADAAHPAADALREAFLPMDAWDNRDETVLLLVDYADGDHPLDDSTIAITIGHNNDHNVGEAEGNGWEFAGWCWTHDHYVQGKGTPIGWMPLPHHLAALSEAPGAGEGIKNIRARADAIAHLTVPEDGNYRSNGQYKREWRIARDAARTAFEEIAAHPTPVEPVGLRDRNKIALAICNEQRKAHGLPPFNALEDMKPHHYRDQLRWADAVLSAITRTDEASTDGEGRP